MAHSIWASQSVSVPSGTLKNSSGREQCHHHFNCYDDKHIDCCRSFPNFSSADMTGNISERELLRDLAHEIHGDRLAIQRRLMHVLEILGPLPRKNSEFAVTRLEKVIEASEARILAEVRKTAEVMQSDLREALARESEIVAARITKEMALQAAHLGCTGASTIAIDTEMKDADDRQKKLKDIYAGVAHRNAIILANERSADVATSTRVGDISGKVSCISL